MTQFYMEGEQKIGRFEWDEFTLMVNIEDIHPIYEGYPINEIILALLKQKKHKHLKIEEQTKGGRNIFCIPIKEYLNGTVLRTRKYPKHRVVHRKRLDWREMFY